MSYNITLSLGAFLTLLLVILILSLELKEEKEVSQYLTSQYIQGEEIRSPTAQTPKIGTTKDDIQNTEYEGFNPEEDRSYEEELDGKYALFAKFFSHTSWPQNINNKDFSNTWGEENIFPQSHTSIKVVYPKGSYKPSIDPRGGAGFIYHFGNDRESAILTYDIHLQENFSFVKGGKLPGLCGGDCARGGEIADKGFSVSYIWKKNGVLEASVSSHASKDIFGDHTQSQGVQLIPGKTYTLEQEITLNTPGKSNGILVLRVNKKEVYRSESENFRKNEDIRIDSVLFSTFFGGNDTSWATPKDTSIIFDNLILSDV